VLLRVLGLDWRAIKIHSGVNEQFNGINASSEDGDAAWSVLYYPAWRIFEGGVVDCSQSITLSPGQMSAAQNIFFAGRIDGDIQTTVAWLARHKSVQFCWL
jgi:hypothetical protein